jgi:hypothetical protein
VAFQGTCSRLLFNIIIQLRKHEFDRYVIYSIPVYCSALRPTLYLLFVLAQSSVESRPVITTSVNATPRL